MSAALLLAFLLVLGVVGWRVGRWLALDPKAESFRSGFRDGLDGWPRRGGGGPVR